MTYPPPKRLRDVCGPGSAEPAADRRRTARAGPWRPAPASFDGRRGAVLPEELSEERNPLDAHPARGWAPLAMRCPECEGPDAHCLSCGGTGSSPGSHILSEGLFVDDVLVAIVEAFGDRGPYFARAIGRDGDYHCGELPTQAGAAEWCETMTGYWAPTPSARC